MEFPVLISYVGIAPLPRGDTAETQIIAPLRSITSFLQSPASGRYR
jgi:hypothetical protein